MILWLTDIFQREILKVLRAPSVLVVSQDSFYKSLTPVQSKKVKSKIALGTLKTVYLMRCFIFKAFNNEHDFDTPAAFDWDTLYECISDLKAGKAVEIPVYSFELHQRTAESQYLYGASVVILEGIFVLSDPELRELMDMKIFGAWRYYAKIITA